MFVAHTTREYFTDSHWSREPAIHDDAIKYEVGVAVTGSITLYPAGGKPPAICDCI